MVIAERFFVDECNQIQSQPSMSGANSCMHWRIVAQIQCWFQAWTDIHWFIGG